MMLTGEGFPQTIDCILGGVPLRPRMVFPKVWTQDTSRKFCMYWSDIEQYGRLHPLPEPDELAAFYDLAKYQAYLKGEDQPVIVRDRGLVEKVVGKLAWLMDQSIDDVFPQLQILFPGRPISVCDIGCGAGHFLLRMREAGHDVTGIDVSETAAQSAAENGIKFILGTAENLPTDLDKFDLVTMFHSFEHTFDPLEALANVRRILKKDGVLLIEVPNHACIGFQIYQQAWFHTDAGRHLSFFTPPALSEFLAWAGFKTDKTEFSGFQRQFSESWVKSMQEVWDSLARGADWADPPIRPSMAQQPMNLLRAAVRGPQKRYDSFRIYASVANTATE